MQTQMWEYMMCKHKPFIARTQKIEKVMERMRLLLLATVSNHRMLFMMHTARSSRLHEKSLELASLVCKCEGKLFKTVPGTMPRNAVLVTHHILFQASLLKLHIPTFKNLPAQSTMSILQFMPSLTVVNLSTLTSLLPLPTSSKVS